MQVKLNTLPATLAEFQALPRSTPEEVCARVPVCLEPAHQKPKRRRGRDGSAAWSPSHDALRQPVPARPSARQGISAACVLRRCDAAERLQAHGPLHAHRPARPTAAGCGGGLSARVFADGGRGRAAPGEAAAEAVDGRVVPLGVFQPGSAVSGYRPRRTRGRKAAVDPSMTTR